VETKEGKMRSQKALILSVVLFAFWFGNIEAIMTIEKNVGSTVFASSVPIKT